MKIFCMSDIHGCLGEFKQALSLVTEHLEEPGTKLVLLGDYVHGGADNYGVLDKVMALQREYGTDKVIALLGNHDNWVLSGQSSINYMRKLNDDELDQDDEKDDKYIQWLSNLPLYYVEGNTIFVHAGIDESSGEMWEWSSREDDFLFKYPHSIGEIRNLDMKVVAGHVGTAEIAMNGRFHDIYYDGASHVFIDGTVLDSGIIPVLMVDTDEDKYYRVTETGNRLILPYD